MDGVEIFPLADLPSGDMQPHTSLASAIWGRPDRATLVEREKGLQSYLRYCEGERIFMLRRNPNLFEGQSLPDVIQCLKANVRQGKTEVPLISSNHSQGVQSRMEPLDLAVRVTFASACISVSQETFGTGVFCPRWDETETLEAFIHRIFPRDRQAPAGTASVRADKLSIGYLTTYAKINIAWTHLLTDHLLLVRRANTKTLHVFRHPAFLRVSLETLEENNPGLKHSTAEALALGCLPPQLLRETIDTFNMLLPELGSELSQTILRRDMVAVQRKLDSLGRTDSLDESFLHPFPQYGYHEHPEDAADIEDVRTLYQKYPYWADRLYTLWREADDPTPTTLVERWSESRKNPRFTYWCTVLTLAVAISFGFVAALLSALQVWISYCTWVDDRTRPMCWKPPAPSPSG